MIKSLRQARITDGLPRVLARQEWVIALSEALGLALGKTLDYTDESQIYTRLDTAPEAVLDVLAVDWKIDWYDTELTVEQKRRIVKTALTVRRLMGTAAAVKLQVHAIYPEATVTEWFQYDGRPGCFRVSLPLPKEGITAAEYRRLKTGILTTKNERSHLDVVLLHEPDHRGMAGACERAGSDRRALDWRRGQHEPNGGGLAGADGGAGNPDIPAHRRSREHRAGRGGMAGAGGGGGDHRDAGDRRRGAHGPGA